MLTTGIRVRFAPSPTGYMHVGNMRTALFDYLLARHYGGAFILRIEDTDRNRYDAAALAEIYESLRWLGLEWDEGPEVGGPFGPYIQSERTGLYRDHVRMLIDKGCAYRCFCAPQRLQQVREQFQKEKKNLGYDRHCRTLSGEESQALYEAGTPHVVRLKVPSGRDVVFNDLIRGRIAYRSDILDDTILLKSDGYPTYHLANVVDDRLMRITHVVRGEEWITSTPAHVLMYEAFGWEMPRFAHMPVILSPDGGKLSKRKGAASVGDYRRGGYLPDALYNFLALLGWNPGDDREKMSREEIIAAFTFEKISPKPAVLDEKKLDWMNGLYLAECSIDSIAGDIVGPWKEKGYLDAECGAGDVYARSVIGLLKERSKRIVDIADNARYFFRDPLCYEDKAARKYFKPETAALLDALCTRLESVSPFEKEPLELMYREFAGETAVSAGALIHPTRLAVSGVSFGPGLFEILSLLGKDTVVRRMKHAREWIELNTRTAE